MGSPGVKLPPPPKESKPPSAKIAILRAQLEAVAAAGEAVSPYASPAKHLSPYAFTNTRLTLDAGSPILEPESIEMAGLVGQGRCGWQEEFLSSPSRQEEGEEEEGESPRDRQGISAISRHSLRNRLHREQVTEKVKREIAYHRELVPGPKLGEASYTYNEKETDHHIRQLKQEYRKLTNAGEEGWQERLLGKEEEEKGGAEIMLSALDRRLLLSRHSNGASFQALRATTKSAGQRVLSQLPIGVLSSAVTSTGLKHSSPTSLAA